MNAKTTMLVLTLLLAKQTYAATFPVTRSHQSTLSVQHGLYILNLSGSPYEIARDQTSLLGDVMQKGFYPEAVQKVPRTVEKLLPNGPLKKLSRWLVDTIIFDRMKLGGEDDEGLVRGVQETLGDSFKNAKRAYLVPDGMHQVAALAAKLGFVQSEDGALGSFGCSSVIAFGEKSATGERIIGRNQDYPGLDLYDAYPAISFVQPAQGYRYVSIAPAGLPTAGITAINEHGLTVALHSALTKDVSVKGYPILTLVHRIVQHSRTIDEARTLAEQMIKERGSATGWLLHVSDRVDNVPRAAVIEFFGKRMDLIWRTGGTSTLANSYISKAAKDTELNVSFTTRHHSTARIQRLDAMTAAAEPINGQRMLEIMQDRTDAYTGKPTSYSPWIVSTIDQTKAVLFFPDRGTIWVGIDRAPVSEGRFIELNMQDGFAGKYAKEAVTPFMPRGPGKFQENFPGYLDFKAAYKANHQESDKETALVHLKQAAEKDDSAYYKLGAAVLALKLQKVEEGVTGLQALLDSADLHPHHRRLVKFYLALGLDAKGARAEAQHLFMAVADDQDAWPSLRKAAASWEHDPYSRDKLTSIDFDLKYFDGLTYPTRNKNTLKELLEGILKNGKFDLI